MGKRNNCISERHLRMLELCAQGRSYVDIGKEFGITASGVRVNVRATAQLLIRYGEAAFPSDRLSEFSVNELVASVPGLQALRVKSSADRLETVCGVPCKVHREKFPDGWHDVYTFTVEGWEECSVTGLRAAKRVINGRLDAAVRNTMLCDKGNNIGTNVVVLTSQGVYAKDYPPEALVYDTVLADKCSAMPGVDVLSPQETANLFGKPVKAEDSIYMPSKVPASLEEQILSAASVANVVQSKGDKENEQVR